MLDVCVYQFEMVADSSTMGHRFVNAKSSFTYLWSFFDLHLYFRSLLFVLCPDSPHSYHHQSGHAHFILEYCFSEVCPIDVCI